MENNIKREKDKAKKKINIYIKPQMKYIMILK